MSCVAVDAEKNVIGEVGNSALEGDLYPSVELHKTESVCFLSHLAEG